MLLSTKFECNHKEMLQGYDATENGSKNKDESRLNFVNKITCAAFHNFYNYIHCDSN